MKPGKNDIPVRIKISGVQLTQLQRQSIHMIEAYGLDSKIESYKGTRPISLYRWDLDCILDVVSMVLDDELEYPDKTDEGYIALNQLYGRLKTAYKDTYG